MLAHRLRHRITIQSHQTIRNEDGYVVSEDWLPVTLSDGTLLEGVPAEVLTGPGRESQGGAAIQAETSARINMRWFPADEREMAQWRILWDGRIYNITSAETDITARREWRLRCVYGSTEGQ